MKSGVLLFMMLLIFVSLERIYGQNSPSVILNTDYELATRYNNNRKSARTSDGIIMVIWEPKGKPNNEIHYSVYDPVFEAWGEPQQLSQSGVVNSSGPGGPGIIADNAGNIYASWKQFNKKTPRRERNDFMFAKWDGKSWTEPVPVESDTGNAGFGSMAQAPDGKLFIAYYDFGIQFGPQNVHACWSADDGLTWQDANLTNRTTPEAAGFRDYVEPCLSHGPDNTMICAWYDEPDTSNKIASQPYPFKEIMVSTFKDNVWSEPKPVTPMLSEADSLNAEAPSIVTDSKNQVHVVYISYQKYNSNEKKILHAVLEDEKLSAPVRIDISADTMSVDRPCISVDENDNLYVVWQEETSRTKAGRVNNAMYSVSTDGGKIWSTPVQMSQATVEDGRGFSVLRPSIGRAVRQPISDIFEGGADVVWVQYNPDSQLKWDFMYYRIPLAKTGVEISNAKISSAFTLAQNYPNPFNSQTEIKFTLPEAGQVTISIYDLQGRQIARLLDEPCEAGLQIVRWNGQNNFGVPAASGTYFCQLRFKNQVLNQKIILLK
jgi:hypothetical protein